jgi:hypothetical protein
MAEEKKEKKKKDGDSKKPKAKGKNKSSKSSKTTKMNIKDDDSISSNNNEPVNPALTEPDAMAIVNKGESSVPAVAHERKKELLVKARADRRKWVQKVPLPYANPRDPNNVWSLEDRLNNLQSSLACKRLPTATKVLSELYGLENNTRTPDEVAERVDALVSSLGRGDKEILEMCFCQNGLVSPGNYCML